MDHPGGGVGVGVGGGAVAGCAADAVTDAGLGAGGAGREAVVGGGAAEALLVGQTTRAGGSPSLARPASDLGLSGFAVTGGPVPPLHEAAAWTDARVGPR